MTKIFSKIKFIWFDIDGVLTDGSLYISDQGVETKKFNVRDGQLIKYMKSRGFHFGCFSSRKSVSTRIRMKELNVDIIELGLEDKLNSVKYFIDKHKINFDNICYIGDDIVDLEVLKHVGVSACPQDACKLVKQTVDIITNAKGGEGVLREILDLIISSQNI